MAATFTAIFVEIALIGVSSTLAIVAGLVELIPLVGPFLGGVPALLIALTVGVILEGSLTIAIWVMVERRWIDPRKEKSA